MPKAPRACAEPGCPQLTDRTRCDTHTTQQNRAWKNPAKQAVYRSKRWRGIRRTQLREQPWCNVPGCNNLANEVDHVVNFTDANDPLAWDRANLQSLCKKHHSEKTAREVWGRKA